MMYCYMEKNLFLAPMCASIQNNLFTTTTNKIFNKHINYRALPVYVLRFSVSNCINQIQEIKTRTPLPIWRLRKSSKVLYTKFPLQKQVAKWKSMLMERMMCLFVWSSYDNHWENQFFANLNADSDSLVPTEDANEQEK